MKTKGEEGTEYGRYAEFYEFLIKLTEIVLKKGWNDDTLKEILKLAVTMLSKVHAGGIVLKDGDFLKYAALEGYDLEKLKDVRFDLSGFVNLVREPRIVVWRKYDPLLNLDERSLKLLEKYGKLDVIKTTLVFPIVSPDGEIEGFMTLDNFESEDAFDEIDLEFARLFQNHVNLLLEKHVFERKLLYLASHDPLTGALNRRAFLDRVEREIENSKSVGKTFGVVYFDLDGFKEINDIYGHECGDIILEGLIEDMSKILRASDEIGRLGGDEFAVLLRGTNEEGIISFVKRFEMLLENTDFSCEDSVVKLNVSIGWALYPRDGVDLKALMKTADLRMYENKRKRKSEDRCKKDDSK